MAVLAVLLVLFIAIILAVLFIGIFLIVMKSIVLKTLREETSLLVESMNLRDEIFEIIDDWPCLLKREITDRIHEIYDEYSTDGVLVKSQSFKKYYQELNKIYQEVIGLALIENL